MSPELADIFLKFLTKNLDIFMQLNHALSVVFHSRKKIFKKSSTYRES